MKIEYRSDVNVGPIAQSILRKIQRFAYLLTHSDNWFARFLYNFARDYIDTYRDFCFSPKRNGEFRFLRELSYRLKNPVVFDVGANVGDYSLYLS